MSIDPARPDVARPGLAVDRRRLIQGAAWSTPIVLGVVAAPASAASCLPVTPAWALWSNTNTGSNTSGTCGSPQPEADGKWWLWCDASTGSNYTLQKCTTMVLVAGRSYTVTFTIQANRSNPLPDAPASLTFTIGGTQVWAGYTVGSNGTSGNPGGTNPNRLTTATSPGGANFTNQTWTLTYVATTTGAVQICFNWRALQRTSANGSASTDDIGTSLPTFSC